MNNLLNVKNFIGVDILNLQILKAFKFIKQRTNMKRLFLTMLCGISLFVNLAEAT